ncbi:MAG: hypothetical protein ACM3ZV_13960 [Bacillota bacterium]
MKASPMPSCEPDREPPPLLPPDERRATAVDLALDFLSLLLLLLLAAPLLLVAFLAILFSVNMREFKRSTHGAMSVSARAINRRAKGRKELGRAVTGAALGSYAPI